MITWKYHHLQRETVRAVLLLNDNRPATSVLVRARSSVGLGSLEDSLKRKRLSLEIAMDSIIPYAISRRDESKDYAVTLKNKK